MNFTVYDSATPGYPYYYAQDLLRDSYGDYIYFRGSDSEYYLICGDIDFDNLSFSDCSVYSWSFVRIDGNYSSWLQGKLLNQSGIISNPRHYVVYGSGCDLPHLVSNRGVIVDASLCFAFAVFFGYTLIRDIFAAVSRR